MKILYDHRIFYLQKFGGISKYFIKVIEQIQKTQNTKIIAPIHINNYLEENKNLNTFKIFKLKKHYKNTRFLSNTINNLFFKSFYSLTKPDIVHLTYYHNKLDFKKKSKIVITVYDLIHEKFGSVYNFKYPKNFKKNYLNSCDKIICISQNTKKDLLKYYDVDENKLVVIPLGVDRNQEFKEVNNKFLSKPFILFVGDRKNYKNFENFIKSYSISEKLQNNFNIVCFGGGSFDKEELKLFDELRLKIHKIRQFSGNDLELNYFYKSAALYVCPSLYEGFGLTLLEAMNMGCPIASSNRGSLQEVGLNTVEYFDPENIENIKDVLEGFLFSSQKISSQRKNFKSHLDKFSWDLVAKKTILAYNSL